MKRIPFKKALYWVAQKKGLDPAVNLLDSEATALTDYINEALREAWELQPWPELCVIERRFYRPAYAIGTTYALGAEVYDATTDAYYASAQAANTGHAVTNATWWTVLTDFARYVAMQQTGQTRIGTVLATYKNDPRLSLEKAGKIEGCWPSPLGWQVPDVAGTSVWLQIRLEPSQFTTEAWDEAATYAADALVYFAATGECYRCRAETTGDSPDEADSEFWSLVPFPYVLAPYVKRKAEAESLEEEGDNDTAALRHDRADDLISRAWDTQEGQQDQIRTFRVLCR